MTMFDDINSVVKLQIEQESKHLNKQELLIYFSIRNTGFNNIMTDMSKFNWLKHKRVQPITNIIKQYIVFYLNKL